MTSYAGADMSQQGTHVCVVDGSDVVFWRGKARSEPAALANLLRVHAHSLELAAVESGALSATRHTIALAS